MSPHRLRHFPKPLFALACCVLLVVPLSSAASATPQAQERARVSQVDYHAWTSVRDFAHGSSEGARPARHGALTIAHPVGRFTYDDPFGAPTRTWEYARWTSPIHRTGFDATKLVSSWNADTPEGTWLQVEMRGRVPDGSFTKWYVMGRWAYDDSYLHRTSVPNQGDDDGYIAIDTFIAADGHAISAYQLRVTLYRLPGTRTAPVLRMVAAMASNIPDREHVPPSPPGGAAGIELDVPRYSQNIHIGEYPEYNGGGEAWCSPTSTAMVVSYWGRGPSEEDLSWVDPSYQDPQVDYAARYTFDYNYEGTGNWPFNTAYAARYGLNGFVTQLRSLTELEQLIKAGIPVVTSQSFTEEELPRAGYGTNGHLLVVIGFTEDGDVIVNDPASPSNEAVRRVYRRANFENVWQTSTGGISYIIYPPGHPLPTDVPGL